MREGERGEKGKRGKGSARKGKEYHGRAPPGPAGNIESQLVARMTM